MLGIIVPIIATKLLLCSHAIEIDKDNTLPLLEMSTNNHRERTQFSISLTFCLAIVLLMASVSTRQWYTLRIKAVTVRILQAKTDQLQHLQMVLIQILQDLARLVLLIVLVIVQAVAVVIPGAEATVEEEPKVIIAVVDHPLIKGVHIVIGQRTHLVLV